MGKLGKEDTYEAALRRALHREFDNDSREVRQAVHDLHDAADRYQNAKNGGHETAVEEAHIHLIAERLHLALERDGIGTFTPEFIDQTIANVLLEQHNRVNGKGPDNLR